MPYNQARKHLPMAEGKQKAIRETSREKEAALEE